MMFLGCPFHDKLEFVNIEKSFSQNVLRTNDLNLQCMIKVEFF